MTLSKLAARTPTAELLAAVLPQAGDTALCHCGLSIVYTMLGMWIHAKSRWYACQGDGGKALICWAKPRALGSDGDCAQSTAGGARR